MTIFTCCFIQTWRWSVCDPWRPWLPIMVIGVGWCVARRNKLTNGGEIGPTGVWTENISPQRSVRSSHTLAAQPHTGKLAAAVFLLSWSSLFLKHPPWATQLLFHTPPIFQASKFCCCRNNTKHPPCVLLEQQSKKQRKQKQTTVHWPTTPQQ